MLTKVSNNEYYHLIKSFILLERSDIILRGFHDLFGFDKSTTMELKIEPNKIFIWAENQSTLLFEDGNHTNISLNSAIDMYNSLIKIKRYVAIKHILV